MSIFKHKMRVVIRVTVLLLTFIFVENRIYLYSTNDGLNIEYYDCFLLQSLFYCRRPKESINLTRDNDAISCAQNGGQLHRFSELGSNDVTVSTVLHQWKSTLERVEQYSRYKKDTGEPDGFLCQCLQLGSFGKNCEYRLPVGETFEDALQWQLLMREENPWKVQMYGDVVCYETLECDSGVLCLDWREICDGIQNCMSGMDEENCDLLEMNRCDQDEYRCMNGMCIPQEFFLDGELDCLDWSDEIQFKRSEECPLGSVTKECDDHICPPNEWSCGDGQCIPDRMAFQKSEYAPTCQSQRDQCFMCETHLTSIQWTMPNGRCYLYANRQYQALQVMNRSEEERCEYLLKCALSVGGDEGCPCFRDDRCTERLEQGCHLSLIQYPRGGLLAPYIFFLFNRTRDGGSFVPDGVLLNGTVRCRDSLINVTITTIPFPITLNVRQVIADHLCPSSPNISLSETSVAVHKCHYVNESVDKCGEWNQCLSNTRIRDGLKNCLNERDEEGQGEIEMAKNCAQVRRHRFRCSVDQVTCLSVMKLGDEEKDCQNELDETWFGDSRRISDINCNQRRKDECSRLRQYVDQSWASNLMDNSEIRSEYGIPFRSYCDTFWNLESKNDENLRECRQSWICSQNQIQCGTGQCISTEWVDDSEWDCADASDEYDRLKSLVQWRLNSSAFHNFTNQSYFVPSTCTQSHPFLCLSSRAIQPGFSCFNLSQIGDGHIDCAGALDERNILQHCSQLSLSMLGYFFFCPSTNSCISYSFHCFRNYRCPNRSDDEFWCGPDHERQPSNCSDLNDFVCFDGQCVKSGRCNKAHDCSFAEDEYGCDHPSAAQWTLHVYRQTKRTQSIATQHILRFIQYPAEANIATLESQSISTVQPLTALIAHSTSSLSLSPYWCNRGFGILLQNNSIVCFCPSQYYGLKCEFHADRLLVLLHLNLSRSNSSAENDQTAALKLLVLLFFNDQMFFRHQFDVPPSSEMIASKKLHAHIPYPHSSSFLRQRREQFFNRSSRLDRHSYSIRIELYQTRNDQQPSIIAVWKYTVDFAHLPVFRFAKVLHLSKPSTDLDPCSRSSCHPNERCQQLMNDQSQFTCLCPTNFTGENCSQEDPRCLQGYCSKGSLCQPNSRGSLPFCLCPANRYGDRCEVEHSACLPNPCRNNGSCVSWAPPNQTTCVCPKGYLGPQCQWKTPFYWLSLLCNVSHAGVVIQYFQIDFISLHLILVDQQVFRTLPQFIESDHHRHHNTIPEIILAKLYPSDKDISPDLYLLSVQLNVVSLNGTSEISSINRCEHRRIFSNGKLHFISLDALSNPCIFILMNFRNVADSISSDLHW